MHSRDPERMLLIAEGGGKRVAYDVDPATCLDEAACFSVFTQLTLFAEEPGTSIGDTTWRGYIPPPPSQSKVMVRM